MPVLGEVGLIDQYFTSLAELDAWAERRCLPHDNIVPYTYRRTIENRTGRLLVCHDFKGGYSETPSSLNYTFNFWTFTDIFIYFSHHRVTMPPPGWTSAAHRHGVKILGTLIFEHQESEFDCLRLFFGRLPSSQTGPAAPNNDANHVPISPHYARVLAELARDRGFDGYLLNFEWNLRADRGTGQAHSLTAWIALLHAELKAKVGPHAEVIWYDSVIFTGQVRWQDRLNTYNLPFFLPSTGFFTNYTWHQSYPALASAYFSSIDRSLLAPSATHITPKTLADVYTGIDVWGRGSHGGGGLGSYRAFEHIEPSTGHSVALFGQGWTWESEQDKPGFSWESWWTFDRLLWLGVHGQTIDVPPVPRRRLEDPECPHGPFRPIADFFARAPAPDPRAVPFCTTFSPGVGFSWFVAGRRVYGPTKDGWTDVDKQCSLGNLLWPRPVLVWEDRETNERLPIAEPAVQFDDAWAGGSTVRVHFDVHGSDAEDAFFRCVLLPVQSLCLSPGRAYNAKIVFKTEPGPGPAADLDVGFVIKPAKPGAGVVSMSPATAADDLPGGWTAQTLRLSVSEPCEVHAGLVVGFATEDATQALSFSLLLGLLAVYPATPDGTTPANPRILWADYAPATRVLSWDVAATYPPLVLPSQIPGPNDPTPLWRLDDSDSWFPRLAYCNIYAQAHGAGVVMDPEKALFVGTTGLEGTACRMTVGEGALPDAETVRFYVQGVTERGEVMGWERCVFVDARVR
ncbi:glycosyl hydrolase family 85-domain-containing protein [Vararia minispora EC-137]|uniref:Glycosyl hydrolase family 85-domain-containing protein n=1 Tax=Vararia minispora EC-137 TaxID=1314806 RepID=A0ACB8QDK6_9AGAM|nr:glycosyl hydrolase family 85-domain-containing protein [Vararia minispora EC-137]